MLLIQCLLAFHYFIESMDYYRGVLTATGSEGFHRFSIDFLDGGASCYASLMKGEIGECGLAYVVLEKYLDKTLAERLFCLSGAACLILVRYVCSRKVLQLHPEQFKYESGLPRVSA